MKRLINSLLFVVIILAVAGCLGGAGETANDKNDQTGLSIDNTDNDSEGTFESATCEDIIGYLDDSQLPTWCDPENPYYVYAGASANPAQTSCKGTTFTVANATIVFALGLQDLQINKTTDEVIGDFYIGMAAEGGESPELGFTTMDCSFGGRANADDPLTITYVADFSCYFDGGIEENKYGEVFSRAKDLDCDESSFGLESYNYKAAVVVKFYSLYESLFEYLYE